MKNTWLLLILVAQSAFAAGNGYWFPPDYMTTLNNNVKLSVYVHVKGELADWLGDWRPDGILTSIEAQFTLSPSSAPIVVSRGACISDYKPGVIIPGGVSPTSFAIDIPLPLTVAQAIGSPSGGTLQLRIHSACNPEYQIETNTASIMILDSSGQRIGQEVQPPLEVSGATSFHPLCDFSPITAAGSTVLCK